ncbi:hypothetical protein [Micromonospora sp. HUAS LYJ1]|nr:hypothetical protein [Micromonospora sp. HUAS LYJ1]WKU03777.1 hypothetical protein Q2K16_23475 [Micromonospora sp. HUAS LYJ1]
MQLGLVHRRADPGADVGAAGTPVVAALRAKADGAMFDLENAFHAH